MTLNLQSKGVILNTVTDVVTLAIDFSENINGYPIQVNNRLGLVEPFLTEIQKRGVRYVEIGKNHAFCFGNGWVISIQLWN